MSARGHRLSEEPVIQAFDQWLKSRGISSGYRGTQLWVARQICDAAVREVPEFTHRGRLDLQYLALQRVYRKARNGIRSLVSHLPPEKQTCKQFEQFLSEGFPHIDRDYRRAMRSFESSMKFLGTDAWSQHVVPRIHGARPNVSVSRAKTREEMDADDVINAFSTCVECGEPTSRGVVRTRGGNIKRGGGDAPYLAFSHGDKESETGGCQRGWRSSEAWTRVIFDLLEHGVDIRSSKDKEEMDRWR